MATEFAPMQVNDTVNPWLTHGSPFQRASQPRALNSKSVVVSRNHLYCPGTPAPKLGPVGPRGPEGGACPQGLTGPSFGQEGPPLPALGVRPGQVSVRRSQLGPRIRICSCVAPLQSPGSVDVEGHLVRPLTPPGRYLHASD